MASRDRGEHERPTPQTREHDHRAFHRRQHEQGPDCDKAEMKTRPKRSLRRYDVLTFKVKEAFPSESPLAVDLLRLMAAYNDMTEVIEWIVAHRSQPTKPVAVMKARVRLGVQHRFLLALMHEAFRIFDQLQSNDEFKNAENQLSLEGKRAFKELRLATGGGPQSVRARLSLGRNKVTFHYDHEDFREGLNKFPRIFIETKGAESKLLFQPNGRAYYMLAEGVRDIIAYGFRSMEDAARVPMILGPYLKEVIRLQRELFDFLDELLRTYMKLRGIDHCFKHEVIHE